MTSDLIHRLETATSGSRELDAEINFTLGLGMTRCNFDEGCYHGDCESPGCGGWVDIHDERTSYPRDWQDDPVLLHYTTSIDAAMTLVPSNVAGRLCIDIDLVDGKRSHVTFVGRDSKPHWINGSAATLPLAINAASLKAREAGDE